MITNRQELINLLTLKYLAGNLLDIRFGACAAFPVTLIEVRTPSKLEVNDSLREAVIAVTFRTPDGRTGTIVAIGIKPLYELPGTVLLEFEHGGWLLLAPIPSLVVPT
jgi:hypothetical protein